MTVIFFYFAKVFDEFCMRQDKYGSNGIQSHFDRDARSDKLLG